MGKIKLHPLFAEIHGELDRIVFRRSGRGKIYLSRKPDMSGVKASPAQKAQRGRMAGPNAYAQAVKARPEVWALYRQGAEAQGRRAFDLAKSDYLLGRNLLEPEPVRPAGE